MNISKLTQDIGLEKYFTPEQFKSLPLELRAFILKLQTADIDNYEELHSIIDIFSAFRNSEIFEIIYNIEDCNIMEIVIKFIQEKSDIMRTKRVELEIARIEKALTKTLQ